jgi:hypothetical protein
MKRYRPVAATLYSEAILGASCPDSFKLKMFRNTNTAYSNNVLIIAPSLGRAIGSIWIALGISMFALFLALGLSGRLIDQHLFVAVLSAILGMANGASALIGPRC